VLVVDDDKDATGSLALLLGLWGHEAMVSCSGPEALHRALAWRPDAALIDLILPAMDGYELARRVRQHAELQDMVLIAVTGLAGPEHRRRSSEAGFARHLVKPLFHGELETILAALPWEHNRCSR